MSLEPTAITHLDRTALDRLATRLSGAFVDDPIARYAFADAVRRPRQVAWALGRFIRYGLLYGKVFSLGKDEAVSVWVPPRFVKVTFLRTLRSGMLAAPRALGWRAFQTFRRLTDHADRLHRRSVAGPHWYLLLLGVTPGSQKRGYGKALMQPGFQQATADGLPCYLETMNEVNIPYYEKHGFEVAVHDRTPGQPDIWTMVKEKKGEG